MMLGNFKHSDITAKILKAYFMSIIRLGTGF
jgi:hypothetical protein